MKNDTLSLYLSFKYLFYFVSYQADQPADLSMFDNPLTNTRQLWSSYFL